ncbi:MAG TPA: Stp1/IreP family PP2C-type Ser/Thr phosphatase [Clostridiales bacterium]|nr:Stp1/IreP family PP2C-type Ser/Thr phosphatase [Clostridiales bacterium]
MIRSHIQAAAATDRGHKRELNEDAFLLLPEWQIYAVADGVGGHNAGERASQMATDEIKAFVASNPPTDIGSTSKRRQYLIDCVEFINQSIYQDACSGGDKQGMATTLVLLLIVGRTAGIINVGDSRAYCLSKGKLFQLTEDHTYVNELVRQGSITPAEARHHPSRNLITQALGCRHDFVPDYYERKLFPGDRLLLCTDGLYNELDDQEIKLQLAGIRHPEKTVNELIGLANAKGGSDNITVVCVNIADGQESFEQQGENQA